MLTFFWPDARVHKTIVSVNIAVYIRSSTTRQSTASQRIEVMEYCSRRGWEDFKLYKDKCSGGKTSEELKAAYSNENPSNSPTVKPDPPEISIWDAALDGNNEAIRQHLAAGTDVNVRKIGEAALSYASWSGQAETVELLIRSGADVNTRNNGNSTPLFHAAGDRHTDVAKLLIVNGAKVNATNDKGETPLDSAESAKAWGPGKKETIAFLRKHGGKTGAELKAEGK
jgi:hypothetical protein